jgi:hypothetical protein
MLAFLLFMLRAWLFETDPAGDGNDGSDDDDGDEGDDGDDGDGGHSR